MFQERSSYVYCIVTTYINLQSRHYKAGNTGVKVEVDSVQGQGKNENQYEPGRNKHMYVLPHYEKEGSSDLYVYYRTFNRPLIILLTLLSNPEYCCPFLYCKIKEVNPEKRT